MHARDAKTVTGDADVRDEPFLAGRTERLDRSARRKGSVEVVVVDQVVELDQIDTVDVHALE